MAPTYKHLHYVVGRWRMREKIGQEILRQGRKSTFRGKMMRVLLTVLFKILLWFSASHTYMLLFILKFIFLCTYSQEMTQDSFALQFYSEFENQILRSHLFQLIQFTLLNSMSFRFCNIIFIKDFHWSYLFLALILISTGICYCAIFSNANFIMYLFGRRFKTLLLQKKTLLLQNLAANSSFIGKLKCKFIGQK